MGARCYDATRHEAIFGDVLTMSCVHSSLAACAQPLTFDRRSQHFWTENWQGRSPFPSQVPNGGFGSIVPLNVRIRANCLTTALGRSATVAARSRRSCVTGNDRPRGHSLNSSGQRRSVRVSIVDIELKGTKMPRREVLALCLVQRFHSVALRRRHSGRQSHSRMRADQVIE